MLSLTPGIVVNMPERGSLNYIIDSSGESFTYLFRAYDEEGLVTMFLHNVDTGDILYLDVNDSWRERYMEAWGPVL
jgi:hypothetical protein